jgi:hypothetical protein
MMSINLTLIQKTTRIIFLLILLFQANLIKADSYANKESKHEAVLLKDHSLKPYFGYREFSKNRNLPSGYEIGFILSENFNSLLSFEAGFGVVLPDPSTSEYKDIKVYNAQIILNALNTRNFSVFASAGFSGDFLNLESPRFIAGGGVKYKFVQDIGLFAQIGFGSDMFGILGFSKELSLFSSKESKQNRVVLDFEPQTISKYLIQNIDYADLIEHANNDVIKEISSLGLISEREAMFEIKLFRPGLELNRAEAAFMIARGLNLIKLAKENTVNIQYRLDGDPDRSYKAKLVIKNLIDETIWQDRKNALKAGKNYSVKWECSPFINASEVGDFLVELTVSDDENEAYVLTKKIIVEPCKLIRDNKNVINYLDVTPDFWAASEINRVSDLNILNALDKKALYFKPDENISRNKFIVALGKTLQELGAQIQVPIDIRYYQDIKELPKNSRPYFDLYIQECGYPKIFGHKLQPNKPILRAEAVLLFYPIIKKYLMLNDRDKVKELNNNFNNFRSVLSYLNKKNVSAKPLKKINKKKQAPKKLLSNKNKVSVITQTNIKIISAKKDIAPNKPLITKVFNPKTKPAIVYSVSAGRYSNKRSAVFCKESLERRDVVSKIIKDTSSKNKYYVEIVTLKNREAAQSLVRKLKNIGYNASIINKISKASK